MEKFLRKTFLIALPIIVIAIAMEISLRNIPNNYSYKKQYLDAHGSEIETLILGSSHAYYGLDPIYFTSNTFNASLVSQTLDYDLKILEKYQARFINLKTIVLPISYFTLYEKMEQGAEPWRIKNYTIYYEFNDSSSWIDRSEVLNNNLKMSLQMLTTYYFSGDSIINCSTLGWGTDYKSYRAQDLSDTGEKAADRHTRKKIQTNVFNERIVLLHQIANLCKEKNIKLLLVTTPAYESYRSHLEAVQLMTTIETARKLDADYENCVYVNLLESPDFTAADYFDGDHLSEIGAKKLSRIIDEKINGQ